MTAEIRLKTPGSMEERIAKRLRSSGDPRSDYHKQMGDGPTRTHTHGHYSGHVVLSGTEARESDPQHQRHHDEATQQTTSYFRGHGKHEQEEENDD
jgi:hypothetical protein